MKKTRIATNIFIFSLIFTLTACVDVVRPDEIYGKWVVTDIYTNNEMIPEGEENELYLMEGGILEFNEDKFFSMTSKDNEDFGYGMFVIVAERKQMMMDFGRLKFLYDIKYLTKKGACIQFSYQGNIVFRMYFEPIG